MSCDFHSVLFNSIVFAVSESVFKIILRPMRAISLIFEVSESKIKQQKICSAGMKFVTFDNYKNMTTYSITLNTSTKVRTCGIYYGFPINTVRAVLKRSYTDILRNIYIMGIKIKTFGCMTRNMQHCLLKTQTLTPKRDMSPSQ